ncbi:MAG: GTPase ObgE [Candidatus Altimarinota bacterium]
MFCDQTILRLIGGQGGNGCVSFRREKFIPKGGPDGGNGGRGGNIYLKVNHALNSLIDLHTYKKFEAPHGEHGMGQNMYGHAGEDLYLEVPLGTIVREVTRDTEGNIKKKTDIADLSRKDMILLIAKGGRGGYGNAHFTSSVRQAPKFAELGEEGEVIEVELELKLVADIGIIGIPSAGKSTLISVVSNAKPKIAAYPFTTLIPNLGVVKIGEKESYVVADIPGLIEGAHEGKGLGIEFLKHVQRCRILVHLIDPTQHSWAIAKELEGMKIEDEELLTSSFQLKASLENFELINNELAAFSKELAKKEQIVVINKSDVMNEEQEKELRTELKKAIGRKQRFTLYPNTISAATRKGIDDLKNFLNEELKKIPKPEWMQESQEGQEIEEYEETEEYQDDNPNTRNTPNTPNTRNTPSNHILYRPHLENPKYFSVEKIGRGEFRIKGQRVEQIFNMTNFDNREARARARDVLKKMGIDRELKKMGIKDGDIMHVGKNSMDYKSDITEWDEVDSDGRHPYT